MAENKELSERDCMDEERMVEIGYETDSSIEVLGESENEACERGESNERREKRFTEIEVNFVPKERCVRLEGDTIKVTVEWEIRSLKPVCE